MPNHKTVSAILFTVALFPACATSSADEETTPTEADGETNVAQQAICVPAPQPAVSEVIPKFDCAPASGQIFATAPDGYTKQACTSYFMIEGLEDTHKPGCHFSVYFAALMDSADIPTTSAYCTHSYVDHVVSGYKNGVWTTLHNQRTYGNYQSGYCMGLGQVGWVLHDADTLGYEKYRFSTHAYRSSFFGLSEAGVSARIEEGL